MLQFTNGEALASFAALTFLEIVLGIDNIVFLAMAVHRLPASRRPLGRRFGLGLAMLLRIAMLVAVVWLARLNIVLFHLLGRGISVKDLVLIGGGLFLLAKGTTEIHDTLEMEAEPDDAKSIDGSAGFAAVMVQIGVINIVFSIDSVITAVGMTDNLPVMIAAVVASTAVMLFAAKPVGDFIHHRLPQVAISLARLTDSASAGANWLLLAALAAYFFGRSPLSRAILLYPIVSAVFSDTAADESQASYNQA